MPGISHIEKNRVNKLLGVLAIAAALVIQRYTIEFAIPLLLVGIYFSLLRPTRSYVIEGCELVFRSKYLFDSISFDKHKIPLKEITKIRAYTHEDHQAYAKKIEADVLPLIISPFYTSTLDCDAVISTASRTYELYALGDTKKFLDFLEMLGRAVVGSKDI